MDVALPASRASAPVCADRLETGIPTPTPRPSAAASNVTRGAVRLCALTMNAAAAVKITNEDVTASARSLPFFLNRAPDTLLPSMRASVMGMSAAPDEAAAIPIDSCKSLGRYVTPAMSANCTQKPEMNPATTLGRPNSPMGITGALAAASILYRTNVRITNTTIRAAAWGDAKGNASPAKLNTATRLNTLNDASTLPAASNCAERGPSPLPGRLLDDSANATIAIGMFTTNMTCQDSPWATAPPITGPITLATPYMADATPR